MKKIIIILIVIFVSITTTSNAKIEVSSKAYKSTAIVCTKTQLGTGFVFDLNNTKYILTCQHIVEDSSVVSVIPYTSFTVYKTDVLYSNENMDIAILKYNSVMNMESLKLSKNKPIVGDNVYTVGNPNSGFFTESVGKVHSLNKRIVFLESLIIESNLFDMYIEDGFSGSAVVNDKLEVVGMINGITPEGLAIGVKLEDIYTAIWKCKLLNQKYDVLKIF